MKGPGRRPSPDRATARKSEAEAAPSFRQESGQIAGGNVIL